MSRWVSLNHARAKASANSSGFSRKRREIFSYSGSMRSARSVVSIVGGRGSESASGPGTVIDASLATHWWAPAGLDDSSHSWPNRFSKKPLLHWVGVAVHVTSRPLVIVSAPLPLPKPCFQPKPISSMSAPSGSAPTYCSGSAAPCVLPNVWPPAISATVSSSFIAMRPNVSRMSRAAAIGSGLPFGPSGLT